jgi:hypothetical protein
VLVCRPFCIFERCLDSNPESCRSKQGCYSETGFHIGGMERNYVFVYGAETQLQLTSPFLRADLS